MKKQIQKDLKIRKFFDKFEVIFSVLKTIIKNESFSLTLK
jgi:hypothetical protein